MIQKIERFDLKQHTKMLIIAIFDALIAQFYFDAVPFEFKFSISVAILPIYYYFDRSLNPIKTGFYVTTVGLAFRTLTMANRLGGFEAAFRSDFAFVFFDIMYGVLFYFLFYKQKKVSLSHWAMVVVFADWISNTTEALFRHGPEILITSNSTMIFFIVALIRMAIGIAIVIFFKQYTHFIRKDEHEIRYKQLLMLTSDLKGEAYFMQNNMDYIEEVMEEAYHLYSDLDEMDEEGIKKVALKIATDVHEIKKNYSRVVEGLGRITDGETNYNQMKVSELVKILKYSTTQHLMHRDSKINFVTNVHTSLYISDHYLLMSVLRNLVNNSIEELMEHNPEGTIKLKYLEEENYHVFKVSDNGSGINERDLKYIFEAGFSTKFNEATGDICRGVGLALVKDIVENKLHGKIEVRSSKKIGTEFTIYIQREYMGG